MDSVEFTAREQQMMALAWKCFDGEPKVDFKKLARLNGMTNPGSAYNAWTRIRKKLAGQSGSPTTASKPSPKCKGGKRTRKDYDDSDEETPTKKGRKASLFEESEGSDEEGSVGKIESSED